MMNGGCPGGLAGGCTWRSTMDQVVSRGGVDEREAASKGSEAVYYVRTVSAGLSYWFWWWLFALCCCAGGGALAGLAYLS